MEWDMIRQWVGAANLGSKVWMEARGQRRANRNQCGGGCRSPGEKQQGHDFPGALTVAWNFQSNTARNCSATGLVGEGT